MAFGSYEVGVIQRTVLPTTTDPRLAELALSAWTAKRRPDTANLTSHAFVAPALARPDLSLAEASTEWSGLLADSSTGVSVIQTEIDEIGYRLYGIEDEDRRAIEAMLGQSGSNDEDAGGEDQEDEDAPSADAPALVSELFDYLLGTILGRWDIRYATGEHPAPDPPEPFAPLPVCPPGMLRNAEDLPAGPEDVPLDYPLPIIWPGILVDDRNHPKDIVAGLREAIRAVWGEKADAIEQEACEILGVKAKPRENLDALRVWFRDPNRFFKDHLARYSKSRRKAPIYWPISTESGSYTLWIYCHRLDSQTVYTCITEFLQPKREEVGREIEALRNRIGATDDAEDLQRLEDLVAFQSELKTLHDRLLEVASLPYRPDLNDGVQITAAPLWKCHRHSPWQKILKDTWKDLEKGKYDWAGLAMAVWPDRVVPKCAKDRSLAMAHGLEDLLWVPDLAGKKKGQYRPLKSPEEEREHLLQAGYGKEDVERATQSAEAAERLGLLSHFWTRHPGNTCRRRLVPKEEIESEIARRKRQKAGSQ
ncbi:MAG TPA: type II restriction endonuclease subunit M [Bacteroidia bacterium]|nr:type II restriction endonuclease subunit M [Bacteroidia bacterium]